MDFMEGLQMSANVCKNFPGFSSWCVLSRSTQPMFFAETRRSASCSEARWSSNAPGGAGAPAAQGAGVCVCVFLFVNIYFSGTRFLHLANLHGGWGGGSSGGEGEGDQQKPLSSP